MWHRRNLKAQARANLKGLLLVSAFVSLVALFLNIGYMEILTQYLPSESVQAAPVDGMMDGGIFSSYPFAGFGLVEALRMPFTLLLPVLGIGAGLLAVVLKIFVGGPAEVGMVRYFLTLSRNRERADWRILFSVFRDPEYLNVVKVRLITEIKIILWTLLLFVPGAIKSYEYQLILWLMAENPGMDRRRAQRISMDLTMGHKSDMFLMDLSILGWDLLSLFTLGLTAPFVTSYRAAMHTELYETLKNHSIANGNIYGLA